MLIVSLALSIIALCAVIVLLVNARVSHSYLQSSYDLLKQNSDALVLLLENEWMGLSKDAVFSKLEEASKQGEGRLIYKEIPRENIIMVNEVALIFEAGMLIEIR
ncbi:Imm58 family immunity protein [Billgrantia aerodenitrificans]|uniref:Immunity protein 58 n=1 Tax=Billgrantia aerodenitrificans TaxID=2733483 RepID=A0ABS9AUY8_9GAMM|nr:Imm58 family immunity protein [Halomonas aerodenitrificans]MCE8025700.1 immunity protein 58 [Halomonas aerodenitrificans]